MLKRSISTKKYSVMKGGMQLEKLTYCRFQTPITRLSLSPSHNNQHGNNTIQEDIQQDSHSLDVLKTRAHPSRGPHSSQRNGLESHR